MKFHLAPKILRWKYSARRDHVKNLQTAAVTYIASRHSICRFEFELGWSGHYQDIRVSSDCVRMGSMEPIDFEIRVLEPMDFEMLHYLNGVGTHGF